MSVRRQALSTLTLGLLLAGCDSDKRAASVWLKQYYECVTVAGQAVTEGLKTNPRLEACLMSKGWNHDSATAISGDFSEILVAGLTETAKNGKAAGDSVMKAENERRLTRARIESMKSGLRDLITAEEQYFSESVKYTTIIDTTCLARRSRGLTFCVARDNVLGPVRLTSDGWTATMTRADLPGVTCAIFIGSTPVSPATAEGQPVCQ